MEGDYLLVCLFVFSGSVKEYFIEGCQYYT